MPRGYDILDIEQLVGASFDAFCEQFEITSGTDKKKALQAFADTAKAMKGQQG
jgi:hypothetical protein